MTATTSSMVTTDPKTAKLQTYASSHEAAPDVLMHAAFVNTYVMRTSAGLLLVDPGLTMTSQTVYSAVRAWSEAKLHTAVYTHGHADHAFGLRAFLDAGERPHIIAQENCPKRFQRYRLTHGLNAHINQRQFSTPQPIFPNQFDWRAVMSLARLWQSQGKKEEARQMLAEIYGWFTEGFDTAYLKDAKALLEELKGKATITPGKKRKSTKTRSARKK